MGSGRCDRRYDDLPPLPKRSPFEQDRDRILRSPAFQRLRHVTQVMAAGEPGGYHTRLTHSLAVARIGRGLATTLLNRSDAAAGARHAALLDPTVVEAACLAHDLGHPPFAHVAEAELDRLLIDAGVADGYEANAQAFRVVCSLATENGHPGLNLTRATLAAILKYPWLRDGSPKHPRKWGAYASEAADLAWARAHLPPGDGQPTLEAQIMDWADLVAYAALDFDDFARAGSLPLAQLRADAAERARFLAMVFARRRIPAHKQDIYETRLAALLRDCPIPQSLPASRAERNALRCYVSHQIDLAITGVLLSPESNHLVVAPAVKANILLLEGLTWHYVIDSDLLVPQRDVQREIIRVLFEAIAEAPRSDRSHLIATSTVQDRLLTVASRAEYLRVVADVVAAMTEEEATKLSGVR